MRLEPSGSLSTHGTVPTTDHFIVHGGTTSEEGCLTPMDLVWLHHEVGSGLLLPEMTVYDLNGGGMPLVEKAFAKANNKWLYAWLDPDSMRVGGTREKLDAFNDNMLDGGATLLRAFRTHAMEVLDDPVVCEGFVQYAVTASSLEPGGAYASLHAWVETGTIPCPYEEDLYPPGLDDASPITFCSGWIKRDANKSAGDLLPHATPGSVLERFLVSITMFAASDYSVQQSRGGRRCIPKFNIYVRPDETTQLWICTLDDGWYAYSLWLKEVACLGDESLSFPPISRGMAILVGPFGAEPKQFVNNANKAFKTKFWHYTLLTMGLRDTLLEMADVCNDAKMATFYQAIGRRSREWGAHGANIRWQTSALVYLYHAFRLAFSVPKGYPNEVLHYIRYYVAATRGIDNGPPSPELIHFMAKHALPAFEPLEVAEVRDWWETGALEGNCPVIWKAAVDALYGPPLSIEVMDAIRLYACKLNPVWLADRAGTPHVALRRFETLYNCLYELGRRGTWTFAEPLRELTLVAMVSIPGMGKSTLLKQMRDHYGDKALLVSSDLQDGTARVNGMDLAISEANAALRPHHTHVLLDACAFNLRSLSRRVAGLALPSRYVSVELCLPHNGVTFFNNNRTWYIPESWSGLCAMAASVLLRTSGVCGMEGLRVLGEFIAKHRVPEGRTLLDAAEAHLYPSAHRVSYRPFAWANGTTPPPSIGQLLEHVVGDSLSTQHGPDAFRPAPLVLPDLTEDLANAAAAFLSRVRIQTTAATLVDTPPRPLSTLLPHVTRSKRYAPVTPLYVSLTPVENELDKLYSLLPEDVCRLPLSNYPHITLQYLNTPPFVPEDRRARMALLEELKTKEARRELAELHSLCKTDDRVWLQYATNQLLVDVYPQAYRLNGQAGVLLFAPLPSLPVPHMTIFSSQVGFIALIACLMESACFFIHHHLH